MLTVFTLLDGCTASLNSQINPPALTIDPITTGFQNPPHAAKPQIWWHWMNGNVNAQQAVADLEWAAEQGIAGLAGRAA